MRRPKRGAGDRRSAPKGRRPERKTPPPEATGEMEQFYRELIDSEQTVALHLDDGRTLDGRLSEAAPGSLQLIKTDGGAEWIQLAQIRYLSSDA